MIDLVGSGDGRTRAEVLLDAVEDAILVMDAGLRITYLNGAARTSFLQVGPDSALGTSAMDLVHPDDQAAVAEKLAELFAVEGWRVSAVFRVAYPLSADGWKPVEAFAVNRIAEPGIEGVVVCFRDLIRESALEATSSRLKHALEHTSDLLMLHGADGSLRYANAAARNFFLLTSTEEDPTATAPWPYPAALATLLTTHALPVAIEEGTWSGDVVELDLRRERHTLALVVSREVSGDVVITARDVTEERRIEADLEYRATHDALTGLPNRAALMSFLGERTDPVVDPRLALLFVDLDRFKLVNDSIGHHFGDELLVAVSRRLGNVKRSPDLLARLGGDEFVVVIHDPKGVGPMEAIAGEVATRVHQALVDPVSIGGTEVFVSASIGLTVQDGSASASDLLRQADLAMFRSKSAGRAQTSSFVPSLAESAQRGLFIETELHRAIENGELRLVFQPIVDAQSQRLVGFEALIRWWRNGQMREPGSFLGVAEDSSLITKIDTFVLGSACRQLVEWSDAYPDSAHLYVAVNMSARQIARVDLNDVVARALAESGLDPDRLVLEITEGNLMTDLSATADALEGLRDLGVRLAIDDFGVGYSSLSYLQRFRVQTVKIDRSFIEQAGNSEQDTRIVQAIIGLAETFGMTTVAEGVESQDQLDRMQELGCTMVQGYLLGRGLAAEEATELVRNVGGVVRASDLIG